MCTEIILALLYFITILFVNFFLLKTLQNSILKTISLIKIKNIQNNYKNYKNSLFFNFYNYSKKESKYFLKRFPILSSNKDLFLIGNTYKYLRELFKKDEKLEIRKNYYFNLLENQYLSKNIKLK